MLLVPRRLWHRLVRTVALLIAARPLPLMLWHIFRDPLILNGEVPTPPLPVGDRQPRHRGCDCEEPFAGLAVPANGAESLDGYSDLGSSISGVAGFQTPIMSTSGGFNIPLGDGEDAAAAADAVPLIWHHQYLQ